MLRFGSVCSGIEAASSAWLPLGMECAFMSEIEAFPRAVLQNHYPDTALHGDFTTIQAGDFGPIDILVGGTPCQSFSIAGLRGGMADERGNLALEYLRLADRLHPAWVVWENVPGVLSSAGGRDFGAFLGGLGELGYGFAYRVLDAQYFGLAQRRKRVFVVGYLGDWRRAAAVLFEPASMHWHPAPGRKAGEGVAAPITAGADGGSGYRNDPDTADSLVSHSLNAHPSGSDGESETFVVANTIRPPSHGAAWRGDRCDNFVAHALTSSGADASEDGTGRGVPLICFDTTQITSPISRANPQSGDPCHTLSKGQHPPAIAFNSREDCSSSIDVFGALGSSHPQAQAVAFQTSQSGVREGDTHATLDSNNGSRRHNGAITHSGVRRLTPRECERLQGFSDHWTAVPYRGKPAADGPRYRALGNSMAVPVMAWIGRRIMEAAQ